MVTELYFKSLGTPCLVQLDRKYIMYRFQPRDFNWPYSATKRVVKFLKRVSTIADYHLVKPHGP